MPPEVTQAIINALVVIIGGMAALLTGGMVTIGLRARANVKFEELRIEEKKNADKAAADEKALSVEREKLFLQQHNDIRSELSLLRAENSQREKDNLDFYKRVVTLDAQLEIVKAARDERERQLKQEIAAREAAEAKLEAATAEWAKERDMLKAEIDDLKRRLRDVELDIRVTPTQDIPAVSGDMPIASGQ